MERLIIPNASNDWANIYGVEKTILCFQPSITALKLLEVCMGLDNETWFDITGPKYEIYKEFQNIRCKQTSKKTHI